MFKLTGEILKKLAPALPVERALAYANQYTTICPLYGINTADIFHEFIANDIHESQGLTRFVEGLNYQAEALAIKFSKPGKYGRRITIDECYRYGRIRNKDKSIRPANQPAIANTIYGGAWGLANLGNKQQGDGWLFRGSGEMMLTGRRMVAKFAAFYNKLNGTSFTPEQMAEMLRSNKEVSTHAACWVFAIEKKLIPAADADKDLAIRKAINGGTFGLDEVLRLTRLARQLVV